MADTEDDDDDAEEPIKLILNRVPEPAPASTPVHISEQICSLD